MTSLLSLVVSNCQFQICISFSQSLSASNPGWRQVPFITLWINFALEEWDSNQAVLHVCVWYCTQKSLTHFSFLSVCLTWKMRLLTLEMMITNDLDFFEGLVQLMDIPVGSSCSKSLTVPDGDMICVVVCSRIPPELGTGVLLLPSGKKAVYGGCQTFILCIIRAGEEDRSRAVFSQ